MTTLNMMYKSDLSIGLLIIAIGMAITGVIGLAAVALASAFVAQITRRAKRMEISQGVRENTGMDLDDLH